MATDTERRTDRLLGRCKMVCHDRVLAEAKRPYDAKTIQVLSSDGGIVLEELHEYPWNACGGTVIDKYGVCWWVGI